MAQGSELAVGYVTVTTETSRVPRELQQAFGQAGRQAGRQGGDQASGGILDGLQGLKGGAVGAALGAAFAVAGVSAAGLFVKSLQKGMEREKALDLTQARLGVDDATMAKIGTAAGRAYTNAFGDSVEGNVDAARRAIQSGLLDPNATAQDTQKVIEQLSGISDLMGEEIPAVARAAGQAIKTGMAQDATAAFDLFAAAERNGLNVSEDFLDTVVEYGTQFRKLGLEGPEALGLINQAVKAGARDVDTAADAIKEFSIRAVDGSKTTTEAFEALQLDAEEMGQKFAAGADSARQATQQILTGLRNIEDPLVRGQVSVALFGTKWEDLGEAFDSFDLDSAAASLGNVAGAAGDALNTLGGNAATSIESAKRSIEVSTDAISTALARAFGPELAKVADWVTQHQPEIIGFLGDVVDFGFQAADAFLFFSSTSLRALADFAEGAGETLESVLQPLGKVTEVFGKLTGNDDLEDLGKSLQDLQDKFNGAADTARGLADGIDNTVRPKLNGLRESVVDNVEQTRLAETVFRALGDTVVDLPDGHTITIEENSPEVQAALEAVGIRIEELPDSKGFKLVANTIEGQNALDAFVTANTGRVITVGIQADWSRVQAGIDNPNLRTSAPAYSPESGYVHYAEGGIREAQISNGTTNGIVWAEAGPEAYIPLSAAKRDRSVPIWMEVGRRLGVLTAMAEGGIVPGKTFAQSVDSAGYELGGFSSSAMDCSGMVSATVNDALGRDPFESRMSTASEGEWLAARGAVAGLGGPGDISIGWTTFGPAGGHTAMTLGDGTNVESNGSEGVVIGGPVGADHAMFDQRMHIPAALLRGGDLGGGGISGTGAPGIALGGSDGGLRAGGGTAAGSASGGGLGGSFDSSQIPAGVTPVWVVNASNTTTLTPADPSTAAPQTGPSTGTGTGEVQTVDEVLNSIPDRLAAAGQGFLDANVDQLLGDMGLRRSGGAIQALVSTIYDKVTEAIQAELQRHNARQSANAGRYMGRA
ncbi:phage tail tape measure protein [Nocardia otitidiscaviarum]|uniref:phage tail tape measure protein n=1 Tax=Nocardia otitidiscaviarum TaxID=1823 RepID=UPI0018936130|nr:phage tail tape measure protein [Nocardia otitidiscaviarum]MBF6133514.1 phage tail tape measure protein [Nocardia otitidiscaviarum]